MNAMSGAEPQLPEPALAEYIQQAAERIVAEVAQIHARIAGEVKDLQALSDRETLAIGSVLSTIVEKVQDIVTASEAELRQSTQSVEVMTAAFLERVATEAEAQAEAVQQVFRLADEIGKSVHDIDSLRQSTELLAINSQIEAARLGEQGRGFSVLAERMRDLSRSVKDTTKGVDKAIDGVREGLPEIAKRNDAVNKHLRTYIEDIRKHISSQTLDGNQGNGGLDRIIELSNKALSHLSFQDPLAQRLGYIENEVAGLLQRIEPVLQGSLEFEETINHEPVDDTPQSSGIMFF